MRSRPTVRSPFVALATAGALLVGLAACTGTNEDTDDRAVLRHHAADSVTVVKDADAVARSAATSRALFDRSPGVVLAPSDDDAAIDRASTIATTKHVPLLLTASDDDAAATETKRLHARWYVPVGDADTDGLEARRESPGNAPSATGSPRASRQSGTDANGADASSTDAHVASATTVSRTTVVVDDARADRASRATAEAAGARTVALLDGVSDPAASADAVTALHDEKGPALLVGAAFAKLPDPDWTVRAARNGAQLPHGGQRPFDGHRYVALYGAPGAPALGVLGEQPPAQTITRAKQTAAQYDGVSDEPVSPALEVIATVASGSAGSDGDYSSELPLSTLEPYVDAAHGAGMPVIIDLQPGRTDFLTQAKRYRSLLERPDVWLALDPEWRLTSTQVPLEQIGSVSADEVNRTADWLADLVRTKGLPPKALVLHEFRLSMITDRAALDLSHPELDVLVHADGQGSQPAKQATWAALHEGASSSLYWGWKNFFDEDSPMLTPQQTMTEVKPTPSLVTYQ